MTNAEQHVQAFTAAYGECPVDFQTLDCRVLAIRAEDNVLVIDLEWWHPGGEPHAEQWRYPDPEIWLPDPAGDVPRYEQVTDERGDPVLDENGSPTLSAVMGRIAPVEVATPQFRRQLDYWRQ